MTWTRSVAALVGIVLAAGLAACGGDDDGVRSPTGTPGPGVTVTGPATTSGSSSGTAGNPAPPESDIDACSLLLPEDVEPLIGATPEPADEPIGPLATCSYWASAASFVQFQVCRCLSADEMAQSLEVGATALGVEAKELAGIGDRAYWLEGILWAQAGDVTINLWISRPAYFAADGTALGGEELEVAALPDAEALAQTVLGRIE